MLRATFDGISEPLILVDRQMRVKIMNKGAEKYYGITDFNDIYGKFCYEAAGKSGPCDACQITCFAFSRTVAAISPIQDDGVINGLQLMFPLATPIRAYLRSGPRYYGLNSHQPAASGSLRMTNSPTMSF